MTKLVSHISMDDSRPDPDALLAALTVDEEHARRGRLKIFFGASPGVGKTCAMLDAAARELRNGVDVVIGYVEPHQRPETAARAEPFEVIPTQTVEHRGVALQEFDSEAALKRRPQLLLVDELAHSNAPGSTNLKRWQDVTQLLDAGIDVWSTLNVQHLESINDQVAQITGVIVRERIPDSLFEEAWEVELVDLPPDDLIDRLRDGKVYLEEQASRAQDSFFKKANLVALREIALRRMAARVNCQLERFRKAQAIPSTWALGDRLLVCVGPSPHSANIIRAAKRMASSLQCPWIAAHVERAGAGPLSAEARAQLLANIRLAESLGAEAAFLSGDNTVMEVVQYARKHNISKIIIGKPSQPRWRELLFGSFVYDLTRSCGEIDIYVISGDQPAPLAGTAHTRPALRTLPDIVRGAGVAVLCTAVNLLLDGAVAPVNLAMVYLLGVVSVSLRWGLAPSVAASVLSVALFDFVFIPPRWTFAVADSQYLFTFVAMLFTGMVISSLTSRVRDQARFARERESRTFALYALSKELAVARTEHEVGTSCVHSLAHALDTGIAFLPDPSPAGGAPPAALPSELATFTPSARGHTVAAWVRQNRRVAGSGTDTLPAADATYFPVPVRRPAPPVVAVQTGDRFDGSDPERQQLIASVLEQVAAALERIELSRETEHARVQIESERLRNALLSTVSHDLRTPLAAIEGAGSTLLSDAAKLDDETRGALLRTVVDEAEHLNRLIANLLDATRLDAGALDPRVDWESLEEIVGAALRRLGPLLAGRQLVISLPADLPLLRVDAVLLQQAIQNIIENAAKYSPAEAPISIAASSTDSSLTLQIADRGPGLAGEDLRRAYEPFYRSAQHRIAGRPGVGLGLFVAAGIITLHRGTLTAMAREGGGTVFSILLPNDNVIPEVEEAA